MPRRHGNRRRAFTLIELLVVLGIFSVLLAVLLPAINRSGEQARRVVCLSNLRQLAMAARMYCETYNGSFPIAQYSTSRPPLFIQHAWDFTTTRNLDTGQITVEPGLLWLGRTDMRIHQCPSFDGRSNTLADPYTGYNYNTSYIGHGQGEAIVAPARLSQIRRPERCALFGDGQYWGGANKFMRSPFPAPGDLFFRGRSAGTQGFRHLGMTNVVFVDGHAESLSRRYTDTIPQEQPNIAWNTGFLSSDNSMYDIQ
jgi:prepilin-type N-terminal cleavage/methylation domain-containing protein/prepilin-type processing-associated H-X9-DG protein